MNKSEQWLFYEKCAMCHTVLSLVRCVEIDRNMN